MRKKKHFILLIVICLLTPNLLLAWNEERTHPDLCEMAARKSTLGVDNYLNNLDFRNGLNETVNGQKVFEWIRMGARLEDKNDAFFPLSGTTRSMNHFHNPLKSWTQAGLDDWYISHYTGESSLLWAQDGNNQQNIVERDWSWRKIREYYFLALTSLIDTEKQTNFAKTFRGLGHQMHLLQDTAVPDHVRNDAHPEDSLFKKNLFGILYFETWAKEKYSFINTLAANPKFPEVSFNVSYNGLVPITQLFDTDQYIGTNPSMSLTQGLSEYTNANFFSNDTIFSAEIYSIDHRHYFPFPKKSSTDLISFIASTKPSEIVIAEDGSEDVGIWISKISDGEPIGHFLRTSYYANKIYTLSGEGSLYYSTFYRDEKCHEDYAQKLIPRAVGYSAGLLNYFFRGTLEISAPDQYVYSLIDGSKIPQQFTKIKAKVINTTPGEDIQNGVIQAVAKYRKRTNYQPDLSADPPTAESREADFSYSISAPITLTPEAITSLNTQPTEFTFDFTDPIPAGITDLSLFVIFKGTLGNETDNAIAVGMKDLKEPTHHVFWNLTDMFSLDGHLYTSNQIQADPNLASLVDLDHDRVFSEPGEPYIYPHEMTFEIAYMAESPPADPVYASAKVTDLPDGRYIRLIVLVDDELTYNYVRLAWWVTLPDREPEVGDNDYIFEGVTGQEENGVWQPPTSITTFRTVRQHFNQGILRCEPIMEDPVTGNHYCAYPEEEAIIPADLSPYPATIYFP